MMYFLFDLLFIVLPLSLMFVQLDIDLCPLSLSHVLFNRLDRGVPFPAWRPSWLVASHCHCLLSSALIFLFPSVKAHTHTHTCWDVSQIHVSAGKKFKSSFNVPNSRMWLAHTPHEQEVENTKVFFLCSPFEKFSACKVSVTDKTSLVKWGEQIVVKAVATYDSSVELCLIHFALQSHLNYS